jgi:putative ABC transport system ATP-binding protein
MTADYITISQLTKTYYRGAVPRQALTEVSFAVPAGQFVAVVGPSGAGKTTLLGILGGLERPTSGQVTVAGTALTTLGPRLLAQYRRETVGCVLQDTQLILELTAERNVMAPLVPVAMGEREKRERVERALTEAGALHCAEHPAGDLSSGERLRVAVARALVNDPELILADEPTGELDVENASRILELLKRLNNDGRTVIMATHDAATADVAHRIVRLREGALVGDEGQFSSPA